MKAKRTALERRAMLIAIRMASAHQDWRWKEAKAVIKKECPCLDQRGWGLACDAYTDRLISLFHRH